MSSLCIIPLREPPKLHAKLGIIRGLYIKTTLFPTSIFVACLQINRSKLVDDSTSHHGYF